MSDLKTRRARADALAAEGKTAEAIEEYRVVAAAYAATGLLLRAIGVCKRILELDPRHQATQTLLASLYGRPEAQADDELGDPITLDGADAVLLSPRPPPLPPDADDDAIDLDAAAAALTPRPAGSVRPDRPADIPLFSGLPPESFRALVERLTAWEADDGALIVAEGEQADSVFVVVRGAARVERAGQELATLPAGSFFGEMALLSKKPRAANVLAVGKTALLELPRGVLDELAAGDPRVQEAMERFCRARLIDNLARFSPLFAGLDAAVVRRALSAFAARKLVAGAVVVEQGAPAPGLFIVLDGELEVAAAVGDERVPLRALQAGDVFGEMSLLSEEGASASVVARGPCTVLVLPRVAFAELVLAVPTLRARLELLAEQRRMHNEALLPDASSSATLL